MSDSLKSAPCSKLRERVHTLRQCRREHLDTTISVASFAQKHHHAQVLQTLRRVRAHTISGSSQECILKSSTTIQIKTTLQFIVLKTPAPSLLASAAILKYECDLRESLTQHEFPQSLEASVYQIATFFHQEVTFQDILCLSGQIGVVALLITTGRTELSKNQ